MSKPTCVIINESKELLKAVHDGGFQVLTEYCEEATEDCHLVLFNAMQHFCNVDTFHLGVAVSASKPLILVGKMEESDNPTDGWLAQVLSVEELHEVLAELAPVIGGKIDDKFATAVAKIQRRFQYGRDNDNAQDTRSDS